MILVSFIVFFFFELLTTWGLIATSLVIFKVVGVSKFLNAITIIIC